MGNTVTANSTKKLSNSKETTITKKNVIQFIICKDPVLFYVIDGD